ncbi:MAG: hypothetical protein ACD_46C00125G0006 [uncultured bacterium]|nr:MAG: hypothetical protein ACD_46C00125G0006 [uncultured bacterium]
MTNEEFRCWIRGYIQLTDDDYLDHRQVSIIKNHANLVEAIMGDLDMNIRNFILKLENEIKINSRVTLREYRKIFL